MATTRNVTSVDKIEQNRALLGILCRTLQSLNVSSLVINAIRLDMSQGAPRYIHHMPAVLEVRGGNGALHGRVEIVGDEEDRAYLVRPMGRTEVPRFPIGAHEETAIYVHSLVRGWRAL